MYTEISTVLVNLKSNGSCYRYPFRFSYYDVMFQALMNGTAVLPDQIDFPNSEVRISLSVFKVLVQSLNFIP